MAEPSLRQLRIFAAAAQFGGVAAAGRALNLSQATISEALRDLEALLGRPLFDRDKQRLQLNSAGRALQRDAEQLLADAGELVRRHSGRHHLALGSSVTIGNYVLPEILARLMSKAPEISLTVSIRNTQAMVSALLNREVDAALVEGTIAHPELDVRKWRSDRLAVIAAPTHELAPGACRDQLAACDWIVREIGSGTRETFDAATRHWEVAPRIVATVEGNELLKRLVASGNGLGCLSVTAVMAEVDRGALIEIPAPDMVMDRSLSIVLHRDRMPSEALKTFLGLCESHSDGLPRSRQ